MLLIPLDALEVRAREPSLVQATGAVCLMFPALLDVAAAAQSALPDFLRLHLHLEELAAPKAKLEVQPVQPVQPSLDSPVQT